LREWGMRRHRPRPSLAFPMMLPSGKRALSYHRLICGPGARGDMRVLCKSALLSILFMFAAINGNAQYQPYQSPVAPQPRTNPPPAARPQYPASWYYDPYTSGSTACPEGGSGLDPKCHVLIPPSYPK
jgi:hypothetical protein